MTSRFLACVLAALVLSSVSAEAADPVCSAPEIFAPGVISGPANDGAPSFTPDGLSCYFTRSGANGTESIIMECHQSAAHWSTPAICPFSGEWYDSSPAVSHDGSFIVFESARPAHPRAPGEPKAVVPSHLWRVEREGDGWGKPLPLPETVNLSGQVFRPSLAADGSLYFISQPTPSDKFRMYVSRLVNGVYQVAEPLPFSDGTTFDVDPEISPDGSFLLYSAKGHAPYAAADPKEHLFIVFRKDGKWGVPKPLHFTGDDWAGSSFDDDPRLSPDGKTVYFSSDRTAPVVRPSTREKSKADLERIQTWDNGNANVWTMALAPWLSVAGS